MTETSVREIAQKLKTVNTYRSPWWKRRGEKTIYLTHGSDLPRLGETVRIPYEDRDAVVTSVLRQSDSATIYGFGMPCFEIKGIPCV